MAVADEVVHSVVVADRLRAQCGGSRWSCAQCGGS